MTVREHVYPIPGDDELLQMVGAATPHFALQIRDRVASMAAALALDDPRQATLAAYISHLERLAVDGEQGQLGQAELPSMPSLSPPDPARGALHD